MMLHTDNDIEYLYARQYAYDLLRRLFIEEPSVDFINYLQQQKAFELFSVIVKEPSVIDAITNIDTWLSERQFAKGNTDYEDLHWDFTRLFIGPEAPPAPPWGSVYLSRDKLLFQKSTQEVKNIYQANGFNLPSTEIEAADHIGFELDFLYHLSCKICTLLKENRIKTDQFVELIDTQCHFLQTYLLPFSAAFCRNIYNNADTLFYRSISVLLQQFLKTDETFLLQFK